MWLAKQRHSLNCHIHLVAFDTFFPTIPGQNSKMVLDRIYMDLGLLHFLVLLARAYLDTASCSKKNSIVSNSVIYVYIFPHL